MGNDCGLNPHDIWRAFAWKTPPIHRSGRAKETTLLPHVDSQMDRSGYYFRLRLVSTQERIEEP